MQQLDKAYFGIGLNHFQHFPDNSLSGCLNDIMDSAKEFASRGFRTQSLTEEEATEARVKAALLDFKGEGWGENRRVVIGPSSHGSQVPSKSERDGLDECTVLYDFDGLHGCIIDDWWHAYLTGIPASSRVYLLADTCHSGDLTRELGRPRPRFLRNPKCEGRRPRRRGILGRIFQAHIDADPNFPGILFSGCAEEGTSADAKFNGRSNGAFTYFFLDALRTLQRPTNRQLIEHVSKQLKLNGYSQAPHLQCAPAFVDETFNPET